MIFIGVGSNLGDRWNALSESWRRLSGMGIYVSASSPVYETHPWGETDQPLYLNAVWEVQTDLRPEELMDALLTIERLLGRPGTLRTRWGARVIDLDLLAYGTESRSDPHLMLPHPWIPHRAFVLGPWKDLTPYFYLPKWQATVSELWRRCCFSSDWGYPVSPPPDLMLPPIRSALTPPAGQTF